MYSSLLQSDLRGFYVNWNLMGFTQASWSSFEGVRLTPAWLWNRVHGDHMGWLVRRSRFDQRGAEMPRVTRDRVTSAPVKMRLKSNAPSKTPRKVTTYYANFKPKWPPSKQKVRNTICFQRSDAKPLSSLWKMNDFRPSLPPDPRCSLWTPGVCWSLARSLHRSLRSSLRVV